MLVQDAWVRITTATCADYAVCTFSACCALQPWNQWLHAVVVSVWVRSVCVVQNSHDRGTGHARVPSVEDELVVWSEVVSARQRHRNTFSKLVHRESPNSLDGFAYSGMLHLLHEATISN